MSITSINTRAPGLIVLSGLDNSVCEREIEMKRMTERMKEVGVCMNIQHICSKAQAEQANRSKRVKRAAHVITGTFDKRPFTQNASLRLKSETKRSGMFFFFFFKAQCSDNRLKKGYIIQGI